MASFAELLQQGGAYAWLFIPSAILLGALHGLEPGHSKTMMAAFIVAIRGTVAQAVLLGLAATVSHTLVVWAIAIGGMYIWRGLDVHVVEPWLQLVSAVIIIGIALWMIRRTVEDRREELALRNGGHGHGHDHGGHGHAHGHHAHGHHTHGHHGHSHHGHSHHAHGHHAHGQGGHHHDESRRIDTGHGSILLEIFEDGVPPRWRLRVQSGEPWPASAVVVETRRPDGGTQTFAFADRGGYLESIDEIPEPHEFAATLSLGHGGHSHDYALSFSEAHGHANPPGQDAAASPTGEYADAHERAHAADIRRQFSGRPATTGQIVVFGLTGGLIPCPAAVTVLLLCLQLKEVGLGAGLVLCFSIGLAITLVAVGAAAALSVRHAGRRWTWFNGFARRAPYASAVLVIAVGLYMGVHGWIGIQHQITAAPAIPQTTPG
jgi:nickel/cobalt exporter